MVENISKDVSIWLNKQLDRGCAIVKMDTDCWLIAKDTYCAFVQVDGMRITISDHEDKRSSRICMIEYKRKSFGGYNVITNNYRNPNRFVKELATKLGKLRNA